MIDSHGNVQSESHDWSIMIDSWPKSKSCMTFSWLMSIMIEKSWLFTFSWLKVADWDTVKNSENIKLRQEFKNIFEILHPTRPHESYSFTIWIIKLITSKLIKKCHKAFWSLLIEWRIMKSYTTSRVTIKIISKQTLSLWFILEKNIHCFVVRDVFKRTVK